MSGPYSGQDPYSGQGPYAGQDPYAGQNPYSSPPGYPYSPQPGYPQGPGGYPPYPQSRGTNGMAIASLIVSCAAIVTCALLGAVGAILGHTARKQIQETGEEGDGLALAGIIIGWVLTGISVLLLLGVLALMVIGATAN